MKKARTIQNKRESRLTGHGYGNRMMSRLISQDDPQRGLKTVAFAMGIIISAVLMLFSSVGIQSTDAQSNSPQFHNPPEVSRRPQERRLRAIMKMVNKKFSVPNVGEDWYRQFRGWDADEEEADAGYEVGPGPTLRVRLGDQVQIAFLNKVNRRRFPYSEATGKEEPPFTDAGCDHVGTPDAKGKYHYPANDTYPNCFHASNTANIHFHGTHTSPDGLGDNVLVQVLPQLVQPDWSPSFNQMFNSRSIPQTWSELPIAFRREQLALIGQHDIDAATAARKNGLDPPAPLLKKNQEAIAAGQWPQYFVGAFPNFFEIPDYDKVNAAFNSGGNGFKAGQSPGTHWYHAHKHGSTSLNIRNGLAGALIIESSREGGYDHFIRKTFGWGDKYGDHEKIFVFQQYDPTQNLERKPRGGGPGSNQVLVNGKLEPTIIMRPGEVQLWRFINATEGNNAGIIQDTLFRTPGFTFKQTAKDGVQFSPDNYKNQPFLESPQPNGMVPGGLTLAAANRADLLVKAPMTPGRTEFRSGDTILFFVEVAGNPVTSANSFPSDWAVMPRFLADLPKPGPNDEPNPHSPVMFQWEQGRTKPGPLPTPGPTPSPGEPPAPKFPPHFMINGKQFGEDGPKVDQCMPKDGLQDWVLENHTTRIAHPFHIHINPFQVIRIETPDEPNKPTYAPENNFVWQDVIAIPAGHLNGDGTITPGRVVIRQAYPDFTGTFVLHCHILAHEDRGMMQLVRIVPSSQYEKGNGKGCKGPIPDHH